MKVMQVIPRMDVGGVERGVVDLAKYFREKKIDMVVVSGGGRLVRELEELGVRHYTLAVYRKSPFILFLVKKLRRIIQQEGVDIVHARSRVPGWISFFATRGTFAHFLTTAHGAYAKRLFSEVMGWGKFVICPSTMVAKYIVNELGVPSDKIKVIFRWVDLQKFTFKKYENEHNFSVGSIGRISPSKGYEYLIKAFKRIVEVNPRFILKIVGEPEKSKQRYFLYLQKLVHKLALDKNVKFLGYQQIEHILKEISILVVPSIVKETFCRVIVEAFACGVPVVATKVGAIPEIIEDRVNGILVHPHDEKGIASAVLELFNNRKLAEKIVVNARRKVEQMYTLKRCASQIEKVYRETNEYLRILIIKINSLGDVILAIPSLKAVREKFPQAEIYLLLAKKFASLFSHCPYIDKVIEIDDSYKRVSKVWKITYKLRKISFDYIIDLQNNHISHLITFLSFPRKSFGYERKWGRLLTDKVKFIREQKLDPLLSQEKVLNLLGIKFTERKLTFWHTPSIVGDKWKNIESKPCIGINVSASSKWLSKNWPWENIVEFIKLVQHRLPQFETILLGDKNSQIVGEKIMGSLDNKPINLCGKTDLLELVEVLKRIKILVSPDTATLHLAQSLEKEVIGLFGPTDPARHTVKTDNLHIILSKRPCLFCYRSHCRNNLCMKEITPQMVFSQIEMILRKDENFGSYHAS